MSEKNYETRGNSNLIHQKEIIYGERKVFNDTNKVWISGELESEFEYSHEFYGEKYYKNRVMVSRISGTVDFVPIVVSERLMISAKGQYVEVGGTLRTYNRWAEDGKSHLDLILFASIINFCENADGFGESNNVYLDGYICKSPVYRITPFGREIADIVIAVNRAYNKSSYIHCIVWGRNAQYAQKLEIGDRVEVYGRFQSRTYIKRVMDNIDEGEEKDAYEISINMLKKVNSDE